jgi:hypothetical protein
MRHGPHDHPHIWYTPADCAAMLDATQHGNHWRAACPAHQGENPNALRIAQGTDKYGHPCTLLYCFAHQCAIADICAALSIQVCNLFSMHPSYAKATASQPRTGSPRLARIKKENTLPPGGIAQVLLEEMIISDPHWIQACAPARAKLWEIAQASPLARAAFTSALERADLHAVMFWKTLAEEMGR